MNYIYEHSKAFPSNFVPLRFVRVKLLRTSGMVPCKLFMFNHTQCDPSRCEQLFQRGAFATPRIGRNYWTVLIFSNSSSNNFYKIVMSSSTASVTFTRSAASLSVWIKKLPQKPQLLCSRVNAWTSPLENSWKLKNLRVTHVRFSITEENGVATSEVWTDWCWLPAIS